MSRNGLEGGSSAVTKPLPALYVYKSELHLFYFNYDDDVPIGTPISYYCWALFSRKKLLQNKNIF